MRISELFGPVRQGEGVLLGEAMPFVRVAGCNLSCSWCDSSYTWKPGYAYTDMTPATIMDALEAVLTGCRWVSVTGGEPTLYASDLDKLVHLLGQRRLNVIVETNGLRANLSALYRANVFVSCSPKLPGSGQDTPLRRRKVAAFVASRFNVPTDTQYKFVIASEADLKELPRYCADVGIALEGLEPYVYVQPDGYLPLDRYLEMLGWLQEYAPRGVRVTPQVHRLVHGRDARGV